MQNSILKDFKKLFNYLDDKYLDGSDIFYTKNQLHLLLGHPLSSKDYNIITNKMGYTVEDGTQIIVFCETKT